MATVELLVIRDGDRYLRFTDGTIVRVDLDKASVSPMSKLDEMRGRLSAARTAGFPAAALRRLQLSESPLEEEG